MVGICFIIGGALVHQWEKIAGKVLKNPCQNGNAMKINIRFYLNKYFWILQLLPGTLSLWNNNFTNWKSLASFIKCNYTNTARFCDQFLCMSRWVPCGFDGKWKTEDALRGLGFDRRKGNIWFQKAEVHKEATPMLLFPARQAAKYQHIILQEPCCCQRTQQWDPKTLCEAKAARDVAEDVLQQHWGSTSTAASAHFPSLM